MRINADSIIYDKNKEFESKNVSEECFKFFSFENRCTGVKGGIKHNKIQDVSKLNQMNYHLQKKSCSLNVAC